MNIFSKYREYLRSNPEGYWFKRKVWGWGWVPARWEGWATLAVFVLVLGWRIVVPFANIPSPNSDEVLTFIIEVVACVALLVLVCYLKGEPPAWQCGFPDEK